jgi:hypothetical protein
MSPSDIEVLLHCHYSPGPHPRWTAPAVRDGLHMLARAGLIESTDSTGCVFRTTERGRAHVAQLCDLPFPTQGWLGADGKLIAGV